MRLQFPGLPVPTEFQQAMKTIRVSVQYVISLILAFTLSACLTEELTDPSSVDGLSISITNPGGVSAIQTPDIVVSISGTVTSDVSVETVTWQNDRGGKGVAHGTDSWATGNIVLQLGTNNITVKATDVDGATVSEALSVERENTTAPGNPGPTDGPVVMYSYNSDLSNAAPVQDASISSQLVYIFVVPGDEWLGRDIENITILCCEGQAGPGQGQSDFPAVSVSSSPWSSQFDLTGFEIGGTRRVKVSANFRDGTQSDEPVFDFTVATPQTGNNNAPVISGSPLSSATIGNQYNFRPTASDADGDTLGFSIENKPSWASFDESTGRLFGTPETNDVGTYDSIVLSVSDGSSSASLPTFSIVVDALASGSANLSWTIPTERDDNTQLDNLAGFNIYYGQTSGDYGNKTEIPSPGLTTYRVENLSSGPWYFVITAFDENGLESNPSGEGTKSF